MLYKPIHDIKQMNKALKGAFQVEISEGFPSDINKVIIWDTNSNGKAIVSKIPKLTIINMVELDTFLYVEQECIRDIIELITTNGKLYPIRYKEFEKDGYYYIQFWIICGGKYEPIKTVKKIIGDTIVEYLKDKKWKIYKM